LSQRNDRAANLRIIFSRCFRARAITPARFRQDGKIRVFSPGGCCPHGRFTPSLRRAAHPARCHRRVLRGAVSKRARASCGEFSPPFYRSEMAGRAKFSVDARESPGGCCEARRCDRCEPVPVQLN
jgi:hypothetical protein